MILNKQHKKPTTEKKQNYKPNKKATWSLWRQKWSLCRQKWSLCRQNWSLCRQKWSLCRQKCQYCIRLLSYDWLWKKYCIELVLNMGNSFFYGGDWLTKLCHIIFDTTWCLACWLDSSASGFCLLTPTSFLPLMLFNFRLVYFTWVLFPSR